MTNRLAGILFFLSSLISPVFADLVVSGPSIIPNFGGGDSIGIATEILTTPSQDTIFFQFRKSETGGNEGIDLTIDFFVDLDGNGMLTGGLGSAEDLALDYSGGGDFADSDFDNTGPSSRAFEWTLDVATARANGHMVGVVATVMDDQNGPERGRFVTTSAVPEPSQLVYFGIVSILLVGRKPLMCFARRDRS